MPPITWVNYTISNRPTDPKIRQRVYSHIGKHFRNRSAPTKKAPYENVVDAPSTAPTTQSWRSSSKSYECKSRRQQQQQQQQHEITTNEPIISISPYDQERS